MRVRDEIPTDRSAIFAVHAAAFPSDAEARLVDQLRDDGDLIVSLVALDGGLVVGNVAFSRMTAPFRALGLAPVAVLPTHQRKGVGSTLIRKGLERAKKEGWQGVFVLGDNAYYERFGFRSTVAAGFASKFSGPHFMALSLNGGRLPVSEGIVAYAPAFDDLE